MTALQRQYPFDAGDAQAYDGAVPEPIDVADETRASGLTLPEQVQAEMVVGYVKRLIDKHRGCPAKLEAVRALLRSAADV